MDEINVIGRMDHTLDHTLESANRVYGTDGICPTIPTASGGGHIPKVMEVKHLTEKGDNAECFRAEQSRAELLNPSSNEGRLDRVRLACGSGYGLSDIQNQTRSSDRERTDKSYSDNGEYP